MRLNKSAPYFKRLMSSRTEDLRDCPIQVTDDLYEIMFNVIMRNCPLAKSHHLPILRKHKNQMLQLVNKRTKSSRRKYLQNQDGGFLGAILPIALSIIGSAL